MFQANNDFMNMGVQVCQTWNCWVGRSILNFIGSCQSPLLSICSKLNFLHSVWEFLLSHIVTDNWQFINFSVIWMGENISLLFAWLVMKLAPFYEFIFQMTSLLCEMLFLICVHFSYWAVWYLLIDSRKYCLHLDIYPSSMINWRNDIVLSHTCLEFDCKNFSIN